MIRNPFIGMISVTISNILLVLLNGTIQPEKSPKNAYIPPEILIHVFKFFISDVNTNDKATENIHIHINNKLKTVKFNPKYILNILLIITTVKNVGTKRRTKLNKH